MAKLNKMQWKIVIAAALLIVIALLFPPYAEYQLNDKNELDGKWHVVWAFNRTLRDYISSIKEISFKSSTMTFGMMYIEYPLLRRLLLLEILGILVIGGVAFLVAKKKVR